MMAQDLIWIGAINIVHSIPIFKSLIIELLRFYFRKPRPVGVSRDLGFFLSKRADVL